MMKKLLLLLSVIHYSHAAFGQSFVTPFEQSKGLRSATYRQAISFYEQLDKKFNTISMAEAGPTDVSYPLHVVFYNNRGDFDLNAWKNRGNIIILVNN